ncbi:MAG: fibrillarin-like rRNA/tRNA 2'-O-methyltransferase [Candidatus Aenigmatarchaeota archaeon]
MEEIFPGVFRDVGRLFTKGKKPENWDPYSSKPAAAIMNGLENFPVKPGQKILYLGAAHGTTVGHFSDIIGREGRIYAVEVSAKVAPKLLETAKRKENIVPIIDDARFPERYAWAGKADLVYEDIAQRDQVAILKRNAAAFLRPGGIIAIALKAKAIDSVRAVKEIYKEAAAELSSGFEILETVELEPFERDHLFIVGLAKQTAKTP